MPDRFNRSFQSIISSNWHNRLATGPCPVKVDLCLRAERVELSCVIKHVAASGVVLL